MRKLRTLFTLLVICFCSVHSAWADRVAPELPAAQTLESGTSYYLYNVIEGKFLCRSTTSTSYPAIGTYGDKVVITATDNADEYTIQWASNNYYFCAENASVFSQSNKNSKTSMFTIAESAQGYTIQRSPSNTSYYKADEFIGFNGNNGDRLNPALTVGSIHWQLMSVDEAEHYFAKHKLYTYLEVADQYNFYITQYELVYDNDGSTTAELDQTQLALENALSISKNYVSPSWTEYPILFQNTTSNRWELNSNTGLRWYTRYSSCDGTEKTSTLTATVNVDYDATLAFTYYTQSNYTNLRVYLDGELVKVITVNQSYESGNNYHRMRRHYIELLPGKHDISWTCVENHPSSSSSYYAGQAYLSEIGIQNTPTITPASTTVEGQLGTEVLKLVDPVSSVKKIIINGVIGADDWTTIGLMVNAFSIDMSGATATAPLPASMFRKSRFPFLHDVKLPQGLTAIGENAFYESDVENEITFPETLQTIGNYAFYNSKIKSAYMQNGITSVGQEAFRYCYHLENASWPETSTNIPYYCFNSCVNLRTFTIPEGVSEIKRNAFEYCYQFNARFPQSLKVIRAEAFRYSGIDNLILYENISTVESQAFEYCKNLVYAEFPTSLNAYLESSYGNSPFRNCPKLKDVYFKSPTVVKLQSNVFFDGCTAEGLTIHVPSFLVSAYKLDPYWYNYNPVGFSTADITDWIFTNSISVVLQAGDRFEGTPNVKMQGGTSFTIDGDDAMTLNDFTTNVNGQNIDYRAMVISNTNNVSISGKYTYSYYTDAKKWYFLCLPFDVKVSNMTSPDCSHAVRYYDGASRATNGTGGNWKNYAQDDIIPAGTGFIYQTSADCWSKFVAENNTSKNNVFSKNEFVKPLAANASDVNADKGWNLVGNPWLSYYNIHKLNFTAPITVWSIKNNRYDAYSIIDDDYAIEPSQALFVQCPDEISSISFPIDGRQLTNVIESQNAARSMQASDRKLVDVELSDGEQTDKTRFVLNAKASLAYEVNCDATKFMSLDAGVPQIYTIEDGVMLAINERPIGEGVVDLGIKVAANGQYTISAPRNQFNSIILYDNETSIQTNLSEGSYTFSANAGTHNNRFVLYAGSSVITNINAMHQNAAGEEIYYNLNGQRIGQLQKGLYVVKGKKVIIK